MIARILVLLLLFGSSGFGDVRVVEELVPDDPGPYAAGESGTVGVWPHSGSIAVRLPNRGGVHRLDALNADEANGALGGRVSCHSFTCTVWRALTGEIAGGTYAFVVSSPIPTISGWGLMVMSCLVLVLGSLMFGRRNLQVTEAMSVSGPLRVCVRGFDLPLAAICALGVSVGFSAKVVAQPAPMASETVVVSHDSGMVSATGSGRGPVVVYSETISAPGAPWIRLYFKAVQLSGSSGAGNASFIRITSLHDGSVQVLDSQALTQWRNTTAYFNGDAALVELSAHPGTGPNRVAIEKIMAGVRVERESRASICGRIDDRVPSTDPRVGRIAGGFYCTAFLFDDHPQCFLTAGHCCALFDFVSAPPVVQFNVEPSDCDGTPNPPLQAYDQYPIDECSVQYENFGVGDEWCYFGVFPTEGLTPLARQGASYQLAQEVPAPEPSTVLRITGYGADYHPGGCCDAPACITCGFRQCGGAYLNEDSATEQTHTGPYQELDGTLVRYTIDTEMGNSGSPVEDEAEGLVYAIHTAGGCAPFGGTNVGAAVDHPGLQGALASPLGVCADPDLVAPGLPTDLDHQARKHRYISVDPSSNCNRSVALKVEIQTMNRCQNDLRRSCVNDSDCPTVCSNDPNIHSCGTGGVCGTGSCIESKPCGPHPDVGSSWFVQAPQTRGANCPNGMCDEEDWYARVDSAANTQVWTLDTLHIGDCEIVPCVTYKVYACDPIAPEVCSDPLVVETTRRPNVMPHYGDVAGNVTPELVFEPPDGYTNVTDITAFLLTIQNWGTPNLPQAHPTWVDLHGTGVGIPPNYILGVSDLTMIQRAFINNWPYENSMGGLAPGACP